MPIARETFLDRLVHSLRCGEPASAAAAQAELGDRLLLAVRYGAPAGAADGGLDPFLEVPNPVLGSGPMLELWSSPEPASRSTRGRYRLAEAGGTLFGAGRFPLAGGTEGAARDAYRELLALLDDGDPASIVRVWNYLPEIHADEGGLERYRVFNIGRARAFAERFGDDAPLRYPASSAVGTSGEELLVAFAAARASVRPVENPRQTSAWRYPPTYGPVGPTFARGAIGPAAWGTPFFLSGTASIVGHETRHVGDLAAQVEETLANIGRALDEARRAGWRGGRPPGPVKVYLRHAESWPALRAVLRARLPPATPLVALRAEICREDLEVEIEGLFP